MGNKSLFFLHSLVCLLWVLPAGEVRATSYTLAVNTNGSGGIVRNPSNSTYPSNVVVTVTATPNAGWYFSGWSGDIGGTINPTNVTMDGNVVMTGNFLAFPTYTLTLATNGQGTISLSPGAGTYASNTVVTVTATPLAGWIFVSWSGSTNGNTNPLSITMNTNNSLAGTFAQLPAFDVQPQPASNAIGSTVSFSAHAVGDSPLSYQWFFANGSLSNATSTMLTLTNVSSSQAGNYFVVATNNYGSATSSIVLLTLTNASGSTNVVNSPDEASLRAAIKIGGWVSLEFNGTITLTNTIAITNNVILDAQNVSATISGGKAVRLFYVAPGVTFCATNLTLANGNFTNSSGNQIPVDGGAIYNDSGTVTLVACTLTNNNVKNLYGPAARGGAIFNNAGTVALFGSSILNNQAIGGPSFGAGTGTGGAIYNTNGTLTIVGCNVISNQCESFGGVGPAFQSSGGAVLQASGSLVISNSVFAGNMAHGSDGAFDFPISGPGYGGAVAATSGSVAVDHSQFIGNTASGGNSGHYPSSGFGGAIYCASVLTAESSTFFGNQALSGNSAIGSPTDGQGGAIYNSGSISLDRCSIFSNYVQGAAGQVYVSTPAPGGNGLGGGIFNASQLKATNCTIALNSAVAGSGATGFGQMAKNGNALGGGIYNSAGATSVLMNDTIASNFCIASGAGLSGTNGFSAGSQIVNSNGTVRLCNSLIAYGGTNGNVWGTAITDDGFNFSSDGSAGFASGSSFNFTDPQLAPLGDYGGPTLCMALLPTSPAIDYGDNVGAPATDQRGFFRPYGSSVDAGAYEYGSYLFSIPNLNITIVTNMVVINYTAYPTNLYRLQASTNLTSWIDLETNGPFAGPTNMSKTISAQGWNRRFFRMLLQ